MATVLLRQASLCAMIALAVFSSPDGEEVGLLQVVRTHKVGLNTVTTTTTCEEGEVPDPTPTEDCWEPLLDSRKGTPAIASKTTRIKACARRDRRLGLNGCRKDGRINVTAIEGVTGTDQALQKCKETCEATVGCSSYNLRLGGLCSLHTCDTTMVNGFWCAFRNKTMEGLSFYNTCECASPRRCAPPKPTATTTTTTTLGKPECYSEQPSTNLIWETRVKACTRKQRKLELDGCTSDGKLNMSEALTFENATLQCAKACDSQPLCKAFKIIKRNLLCSMQSCGVGDSVRGRRGTTTFVESCGQVPECPTTTTTVTVQTTSVETTTTSVETTTTTQCWSKYTSKTKITKGRLACRDKFGVCTTKDRYNLTTYRGRRKNKCQKLCDAHPECGAVQYIPRKKTCSLHKRCSDLQSTLKTGRSQTAVNMCSTEFKCIASTTTTTPCAVCNMSCPAAEVLDLRLLAWSNLGCEGPNQTVIHEGVTHKVPCSVRYFNVLNATNWADVVYLDVENVTTYSGDAKVAGTSKNPANPLEEGAYGTINMNVGTSTKFRFTVKNSKNEPKVLDKVLAITFYDIDQEKDAACLESSCTASDADVGGESVDVCTGPNSWAFTQTAFENTGLNHSYAPQPNGEVCHNFASKMEGDSLDNPWNPLIENDDGSIGLSAKQKSKAFVVAFYGKSSFEVTFSTKRISRASTSRNFLFSVHPTDFCAQEKADMVIEDTVAAQ